MSDQEMFKKWEAVLGRNLIPDERRFLSLANKLLEKDRLRNLYDAPQEDTPAA
jgi:hypothetical protein